MSSENSNLNLKDSEPNFNNEPPLTLLDPNLGVAPLDLHLKESVLPDWADHITPPTDLNENISPHFHVVPTSTLDTLPRLLSPIPTGDSLGYVIMFESDDPSSYHTPDSYILPTTSLSFPVKDLPSPSWLTLLDHLTTPRRLSVTLAETPYGDALLAKDVFIAPPTPVPLNRETFCPLILRLDIYHGMFETTGFRTKGSTSARRKHVELICPTATDIMSRYTTFQDFPFNPHFDINVNAVNHYFPSPAISCVEAPPVIGHVSQMTFPEPNKLHVEACDESSTSKATKDVHISAGLMEEFMELAKVNTEKDLETCGILGASLKKHTYYITTLVMPKQESTSSSCQALNEEEIHAILDGESLYPAGWIHTHPSQTCFLSSIDLHTQYSYQVMLPEAVAIVMAPTDPERKSGIFRLTDPGGINVVGHCEERGFHPHPETADGGPIYENCSDVYINPNLRYEIFDMRLRSTY
ncbi:hypothetical protein M5K25_025322 [Dendrobium thyrsiflorum]|uniref:MPN domain-containing protein n=1 Tax=Dendrobium thyrsiflorum TaxID=117978 RepID=A0ABD0U478_DENTH